MSGKLVKLYTGSKQTPRKTSKRGKHHRNKYPLRSGARNVTICRQAGIAFGQEYVCQMKYGQKESLVSAGMSAISYRMNSLFDPPIPVSTDQPYYWDQLSAIYNKFTVYRYKYKVVFANNTDPPVPSIVACQLSTNSTIPTNERQLIEDRNTKWRVIASFKQGSGPIVLKKNGDVAAIFGVSKYKVMTDNVFSGSTVSNPDRLLYLHVLTRTASGSASAMFAYVELTMYARWYSPKTVGSS